MSSLVATGESLVKVGHDAPRCVRTARAKPPEPRIAEPLGQPSAAVSLPELARGHVPGALEDIGEVGLITEAGQVGNGGE